MKWHKPHNESVQDYQGFVYLIEELNTGMYYIGKKNYWKIIKYPPLKGRKNKRHKKVESDWKEYNSSNKILQEEIMKHPDNYRFTIIKNCKDKTEMAVWETYYQLQAYTRGEWHKLYNETVNLRVRIRK